MPFIHIKSLPFTGGEALPGIIKRLSTHFSEQTDIEARHVTVTWEFFKAQHYLFGGVSGDAFDPQQHQVLVDLLVPDFNNANTVEKMMRAIATSLTQTMKLPKQGLFINCRYAGSAMVMDAGEIVRW